MAARVARQRRQVGLRARIARCQAHLSSEQYVSVEVGRVAPHGFFRLLGVDGCSRKAGSWALAAKTSATASLNSRPCSTKGRICSTHSSGIPCVLPATTIRERPNGMPSASWAQWQVGVPQRRWVRASEPGRASAGMEKRRSRAYLRCRKRACGVPICATRFPLDSQDLIGVTWLERRFCLPSDEVVSLNPGVSRTSS